MTTAVLTSTYEQVIFFSLIGGVFSLIGGALLLSRRHLADKLAKYATPFAAGALLAAAFFDLLPEAIERTAEGAAGRWLLLGLVLFFLLEHSLQWFHHHHEHEVAKAQAAAPLIVIGDTLHNLLDGMAIGAAFLISPATGIVTTVAVAAHEIPQEIGDFGLLLKAGYLRSRVLYINVISALMTLVGALAVFSLGNSEFFPLGELLAVTAGMFIYIAASDLIPSIHETSKGRFSLWAAGLLILGILTVGLVTELAHESLPHDEHNDGSGLCERQGVKGTIEIGTAAGRHCEDVNVEELPICNFNGAGFVEVPCFSPEGSTYL